MGNKQIRIGIDVGGTFTDAVAIDNETFEVLSKVKIPTTHHDKRGVASGIVTIIQRIMSENGILPPDIKFIAHGTTQATNALLEGDVARVGILGMGTGMDARSARSETNVADIELATGKYLKTYHRFIDSKELTHEVINDAIEQLLDQGAEVIVASEAYSVDDPSNELRVIEAARSRGVYATGGHEISQLYGLKTRTRTAVVNASLIPKMMETANMTEQAVKEAGISSQLMIMRCDGGVMSIDEVRKRPILTMLSGLAAGVAGALMYEKISDGIFFEVGGTSVDISVIKNGKVMIENAQVGGHKTYLRSLDVRTLAVAGGSMIQIGGGKITDVGPRSAHIAGLEYECFAESANLAEPSIGLVSPREGDPDYVTVRCAEGHEYALTLAGAANLLNLVPEDDYARGNVESDRIAWDTLGAHLGISAEEAARSAMDIAIQKVMVVVSQMITDYELDTGFVTLVGGGGSGAVLVPAMAAKEGFKHQIANNAPYISTIGVGMAMVREQIEKTVVGATERDIKLIRMEIIEKIVQSGANESTVDVTIEIDAQRNILRAIATGSTELRSKDLGSREVPVNELLLTAAQALNQPEGQTELKAASGRWFLFEASEVKKSMFGLVKKKLNHVSVLDRQGVVRFKKANAFHLAFVKKDMYSRFASFLDENTIYSDANATIPKAFIFYKEKMLDLTGMQTKEQLFSILEVETQMLEDNNEMLAVVYQ
ncbi:MULTISPECIES: hydantoinase/oxoprolinase family protein [Paenibacillus]|uniref:hydantoinase/oxoprolinase family protein n=1 Tax=Paenibacillus sonchi TaxID=373687 RepID=UPI0002F0486D|nr:hydantoinase/oxoprolinase family protein [Paenibacillus sonchi]